MSANREERRWGRWLARILAPIALVAAGAAVAIVVAGSLDGAGGEETDARDRPPRRVEGCTPSEPEALSNGYYIVEEGEPGMSAVEASTCIRIEVIERFNPDLDPQLIPAGECVNLRRNACRDRSDG